MRPIVAAVYASTPAALRPFSVPHPAPNAAVAPGANVNPTPAIVPQKIESTAPARMSIRCQLALISSERSSWYFRYSFSEPSLVPYLLTCAFLNWW